MTTNIWVRKFGLLGLGVLLASLSQMSIAADWVYGRVTAYSPQLNQVVINNQSFTFSSAERLALESALKNIQPGQRVRYEADGKTIKRIEVLVPPPA